MRYPLQYQMNCGERQGCYVTWNGQPSTSLQQKRWTNVQIAEITGHHRDTIARVLREEVDKKPKTRERTSAVAVFDAQIAEWLDQNLSVIRMLEARTCQRRASLRWERHRLLRICAQNTPCPQTGSCQSASAF